MAPIIKAPTEGDILKFDLNQNFTREVVTLLAGTNYQIGSVVGQITTSGKVTLSPVAETVGIEGAQTAIGVLVEAVDATDGDRSGVIIRRGPAIVARQMLVYHSSVDQPAEITAKLGQLTLLGIVARDAA